ncbi:hypothetical protein TEA_019160 [Camellia sinensis var. sinensis]|uniref:Diphthine--ammonia ligase n=1 Tax=Camellia sinensis var. sinensis TaxID=542762 RepID=A0A4S4EK07_CAMSN|nr:hypothetical protein TEA_019160 [Camellia sinensis var. sinensis]
MKVVGLVSGGKDSCYAMMKCIEYGHEIVALANLLPIDDSVDELDSYMYQTGGHGGALKLEGGLGWEMTAESLGFGTAVMFNVVGLVGVESLNVSRGASSCLLRLLVRAPQLMELGTGNFQQELAPRQYVALESAFSHCKKSAHPIRFIGSYDPLSSCSLLSLCESGILEFELFNSSAIVGGAIDQSRRTPDETNLHHNLSYTMTAGDEVEDLFILLNEVKRQIPSITAVSSGAIASDYQRLRVESVCSRFAILADMPVLFQADKKRNCGHHCKDYSSEEWLFNKGQPTRAGMLLRMSGE